MPFKKPKYCDNLSKLSVKNRVICKMVKISKKCQKPLDKQMKLLYYI